MTARGSRTGGVAGHLMLGYQKSVPGHAACSAVQSFKVSESETKPKTKSKTNIKTQAQAQAQARIRVRNHLKKFTNGLC